MPHYCYVAYHWFDNGWVVIGIYETLGAAKGVCTARVSRWSEGGKRFHNEKWVEDTVRGLCKRGNYRVLQVPYKIPEEA